MNIIRLSRAENRLVDRYLAGDEALARRLGGDPRDDASYAKARDSRAGAEIPQRALVDALLPHHEALGADAASLASVRDLGNDDTFVVATGQQPGLLTGPLYSVLKAATTIALARDLESRLSCRVVPVYWVASDDHDLGEIEGCTVLDPSGHLRRLRVSLGDVAAPSSMLAVPAEAKELFETFLTATPAGPHTDALRALAAPRANERWPDWLSRLHLGMFPGTGLVVFEPAIADAVVSPLLARERQNPVRAVAARAAGRDALRALDIDAPLSPDVPSALFHVDGGRRRRLDPTDSDATSITADAGLRPAIQSMVLPVIATVGGPGELAYWLQLTETFDACGAVRPVFVPRSDVTLVEPRVRRALQALDLDDAAFLGGATESEPSPNVDTSAWAAAADRAFAAHQEFASDLSSAGGKVPRALDNLARVYRSSLDKIVKQAADAENERAGASSKRRLLTANAGRPHGKPQDRVLNALPFLAREGLDLYARLAAELDPLCFDHHLVHLEGGGGSLG